MIAMNVEDLMRIIGAGENERVEFKRIVSTDFGEEIVAISNSGGGYIVVGLDDDGKIVGCDVNKCKEKISSFLTSITPPVKVKFHSFNIERRNLLVVEIEGSKSITTIGGQAYIRVGVSKRPLSLSEIISLGAEYVLIPIDSTHTSIKGSEIDTGYWRWFLRKRREKGLKEVKDLKRKLNIIKRINNEDFLTLAGLLFFYRNPQEIMPHTYVRIIYGDSWERVEGPIWRQVEYTVKKLLEILPKKSIIKGVRRIDLPVIPIKVLREAIVNALVHRNYGIYSEVFIEIKGNILEIRNPGSFPPGTTPDNPIPIPRNPVLYELMFETGYVERQGGGIDMMKKICRENDIKMNYIITPYYTRLILEYRFSKIFTETERKIISLLTEPRSSSELAKTLNLSKPTIIKILKKLEKKGIVKSIGRGPKTKWIST